MYAEEKYLFAPLLLPTLYQVNFLNLLLTVLLHLLEGLNVHEGEVNVLGLVAVGLVTQDADVQARASHEGQTDGA